MIQIEGIKRHVYMKLVDSEPVLALPRGTGSQAEYKYPSGELSIVNISLASLGTKRIRITNLPPEVSNDTLRATLAPYGKIMDIQNERLSKAYRYSVANGVRQVTMCLSRHVPSHLTVAGQRVLLSYEGKLATCYGCGEAGHMYQQCSARQKPVTVRTTSTNATNASIATAIAATTEDPSHDVTTGNGRIDDEGTAPSTAPNWSLNVDDTDNSVAQAVAPDTPETFAAPAPPDGADDVTETSQRAALMKPRQRMEVPEPHGDFTISQNGQSRTQYKV